MMVELIILFYIILIIGSWILSEVILAKSIKKSDRDDSVWLVINILLPVVGCILYKVIYDTKNS